MLTNEVPEECEEAICPSGPRIPPPAHTLQRSVSDDLNGTSPYIAAPYPGVRKANVLLSGGPTKTSKRSQPIRLIRRDRHQSAFCMLERGGGGGSFALQELFAYRAPPARGGVRWRSCGRTAGRAQGIEVGSSISLWYSLGPPTCEVDIRYTCLLLTLVLLHPNSCYKNCIVVSFMCHSQIISAFLPNIS